MATRPAQTAPRKWFGRGGLPSAPKVVLPSLRRPGVLGPPFSRAVPQSPPAAANAGDMELHDEERELTVPSPAKSDAAFRFGSDTRYVGPSLPGYDDGHGDDDRDDACDDADHDHHRRHRMHLVPWRRSTDGPRS